MIKKYFLTLIFFFTLQLSYAMENENQKNINIREKAHKKLLNILEKEGMLNTIEKNDWQKIKKYLPLVNPNLEVANEISLLSLCVNYEQEDLVYNLLQRGANPNGTIRERGFTPLHTILLSLGITNNNIETKILENLLKYKADVTIKTDISGATPLEMAIDSKRPEVVKLLIKYGADINQINKGTLLKASPQIIKDLCNAGAPITTDQYGFTTFHSMVCRKIPFHSMVCRKIPKENIEAFLTHVRKNKKNDITKTIKTALLIFNSFKNDPNSHVSKIPHEIQYRILSYLLSEDYFHLGLCKKLLSIGYNQHQLIFSLVKNRITWLQEMLQKKDNYFDQPETASESLLDFPHYEQNYKNEVVPLLDGSKLTEDYNILTENPDLLNPLYLAQNPEKAQEAHQNLAWQIADSL